MHRDKILLQRMDAACRNVTRGSCCTKRFADFNGNCEGYRSLEQLVASLYAAHEGKSASGTYHPKTEGYTRRYLYRPPGLLYCGECTWTTIRRQPIIAITWHFCQQTLLEPLIVTGAIASCFGERYRDILSHDLDENNSSTQTSTDRCTGVCEPFNYSIGVCVCATYWYSLLGTCGIKLCTTCRRMIPLLLCRQQERSPQKDIWNAEPPAKRLCLP